MTTETPEFVIEPKIGAGVRTFLYSQLFVTPPYPSASFAGQTVIVTGSNVGLGLEAARHFYRLNCAKLILAVRTPSKGEAAKEDIARSVQHRSDASDAIKIWPLELGSTTSTLAFAERVKTELPRVDVLVEGAGISGRTWAVSEGFELSIQVNVINTFLLALSLLPKLAETKTRFPESQPHLTIVSSEAHRLTKFNEINAPDIYEMLNDEKSWNGPERYQIGKLIQVLLVREIVSRLDNKSQPGAPPPPVVITIVNPGLADSALDRNISKPGLGLRLMRLLLQRTTEVGARTFVLGACAGSRSHGEFMSDGKNQDVESWIYTDVGKRVQKKVFEQTAKVLEARKPGVVKAAGL